MYKLFTFIPGSPGEGYALRFSDESIDACDEYAFQQQFEFYRIEFTENGMSTIVFETQVVES